MNRLTPLLCAVAVVGCVGEADWALAPTDPTMPVDPGMGTTPPVKLSSFTGMSAGLPTSTALTLSGTAQLNSVLYAVANGALYSLASGGTSWAQVTLPVAANEAPTQVTRIDTSIYVTSSDGAGHGGLYVLTFGNDSFVAVAGLSVDTYALVKKDDEFLLTTTGALMASSDGSVWTTRSSDAIFAKPVSVLVAAAAATRIFALVAGALEYSDDAGATWSSGLVTGTVAAVQAAGANVLVQTSTGTVRSDNYGNTFHAVDIGGTAQAFAISSDHVYAGTGTGLRISSDGGATWSSSGDGLPVGGAVNQLFLSGAALVAATGGLVYVAQIQ